MLTKIISGGQTGADRGALEAAIFTGFPYSGYVCWGRKSEDGGVPDKYELIEVPSHDYKVRTEMNVLHSDGTVIFVGNYVTPGSYTTIEYCKSHGTPYLLVDLREDTGAPNFMAYLVGFLGYEISEFIRNNNIRTLNVAGVRESKRPGTYDQVFRIMSNVLTKVKVNSTVIFEE